MIKKPKTLVSNPRCLHNSWIRVVFAKVLMLAVFGACTCALSASLLGTWIYSEF